MPSQMVFVALFLNYFLISVIIIFLIPNINHAMRQVKLSYTDVIRIEIKPFFSKRLLRIDFFR